MPNEQNDEVSDTTDDAMRNLPAGRQAVAGLIKIFKRIV